MSDLIMPDIRKSILHCCSEWTIDSIVYLGEGDFCTAYVVNDGWVFRFAKHDEARLSLKREYCLLPKLAGKITLSIPSPQFAYFEDNSLPSFVAYPLLPGEFLSQEGYINLNDSNRRRCAEQLANFLNQIHSTDIASAEKCGVLRVKYENQYLELLKRAQANLFTILNESERSFIKRVINDCLTSETSMNFQPKLLHGDFSPEHVFFDEQAQQISAVIDFGDVMIGDAAWDFLWIYEDYGLDLLSRMLPTYCETEKAALLQRVFQFSKLSLIDWAVSCHEKDDGDFAEAVTELRILMTQEEWRLNELLSINRAA